MTLSDHEKDPAFQRRAAVLEPVLRAKILLGLDVNLGDIARELECDLVTAGAWMRGDHDQHGQAVQIVGVGIAAMTKLGTRVARAAAVLLGRQFDAAGASPRWPASAIMASQSSAALAARSMLAKKAGYLANNAPIAASLVDCWMTNLVSDGPSARAGHPNAAMREALEAAWSRLFRRADVEGGDLVSVLNRVVRGLVVDGESFVRLLTVGRGELKLQILPPSQIDPGVNRQLADGGAIVAGIERGPNGEPRACWVLPAPPDAPLPSMIGPAVRVDAADICHVLEPRFAGQVRGLSWLHPVATSILELDATQDAAVMKAKVSCLMAGFIRDLDGAGGGDLASGELSLEPGVLRRLRAGEDVTFSPTGDFEGLNGFLVHMARSISAGAGVPYEFATGDLSNTNYSSAKYGGEGFKRRCRAIRASVLVSRLLQPAWERCITLEILSGRLSASDFADNAQAYFDVAFLWPEWSSLDPLKEARSDIELLEVGLRSRAEIVSARGRDLADLDAELAADAFVPRAPPRPRLTVVGDKDAA